MSSTHATRAIVGDWVRAGAFWGLSLGAICGLLILAGPLAVVGILIGGTIGLVSGVTVGVMNGIELACLFKRGALGETESSRRRRAALAAGLTSAVVSFAIFDWANGADATALFVFVPTAIATLVGVALSQILEPNRSDARR
jgi:hypothetical protein